MIKESCALKAQMPIKSTLHTANQADGKSKLDAVGEVHVTLTRGSLKLQLEAVVVKDLDSDLLAGVPFMKEHNICLDIANDQVFLGKYPIPYDYVSNKTVQSRNSIHAQSYVLRATCKEVILPGEFMEVASPQEMPDGVELAFTPRSDAQEQSWPSPDVTSAVGGVIRIPNTSSEPVLVKKNQHVAQVMFTTSPQNDMSAKSHTSRQVTSKPLSNKPYSADIHIDPDDQLTHSARQEFQKLHNKLDCIKYFIFKNLIHVYQPHLKGPSANQ